MKGKDWELALVVHSRWIARAATLHTGIHAAQRRISGRKIPHRALALYSLAQLIVSLVLIRNIAYILHQASYQMHHKAPYQTALLSFVGYISPLAKANQSSHYCCKKTDVDILNIVKSPLLSFLADAKYACRVVLQLCGWLDSLSAA